VRRDVGGCAVLIITVLASRVTLGANNDALHLFLDFILPIFQNLHALFHESFVSDSSSSSSTGRVTRRILRNLASKSVTTRHRAFSYTKFLIIPFQH